MKLNGFLFILMVVPAGCAFAQDDSPYTAMHPKVRALQDRRSGNEERLYDSGTRALDADRWEEAAKLFSEAADQKSPRADGALYWKAYAENRMGRRDAALATIAALKKDYASSRWLNDAQALEVEVKQQAGKPVSPDSESNDDLKLLALNGLLHSDPDQALPIIEKLLKSNNSPKMKDRALFVLSQSHSPKAWQILMDVAKGGANPDLQAKAIRDMALSGNKDARQQLVAMYTPASDVNVKREIIRGMEMMQHSQTDDSLVSIYNAEQDQALKREVVNALFVQQNAKALVDLARKENNAALKQDMVQKLSLMRSKEATAYMLELLQK